MVRFEEAINKLREEIFLKKGSGQNPSKEESALKALEHEAEKEARISAEIEKGIEEKEKAIKRHERKAAGVKEKIVVFIKEFQDLLRELNKEELQAEVAFEERLSLLRQSGVQIDSRSSSYRGRSVWTGSTRTQWVDDPLNPFTEDFRREVISDQAQIVVKKGRPRRVRQPVDSRPRFIPEQYETFKAVGIDMPASWDRAYERHQKAMAAFIAKNPEAKMNS